VKPRTARDARGFTLLELLIALAIVGALLGIAFGGLRVALAAWRQGEDRAESHQHARGLASVLAHAVEGAYPYRGSLGLAPTPVILFEGGATALKFVTRSAPFPFPIPIAFTAVVIALDDGESRGLVVKQRALPNQHPFAEAGARLTDASVTALTFRYRDLTGAWRETWDAAAEQELPQAVEISLAATLNGRSETMPPLTVALRTTRP
jgi:general secretion pathway protein J